jgi:26S proteasome regulatory subunit N9
MALIESVFRRSSDDRVLSFQSIAEETKVPVREVEYLVMKALSFVPLSNLHLAAICVHLHPPTHAFLYSPSLKLIRGSLDSISQTATVTWVQPRVLDRSQLEALARRLTEWTDKVGKVGEVSPVVIPVALSLLDPSTLTRIIIFFRSFTGCSTSETAALGLRSSRVRCP